MGSNNFWTLVTGGALACSALATPAFADVGTTTERVVHTVAHFTDPGVPGFSRFGADCPVPPATPDGCGFTFSGVTNETGGLAGSTAYDGRGGWGGSTDHLFRWTVKEKFTGVVEGCGRGSITWEGSGYGDVAHMDPATQQFRLWGTVTIVAGSGDLRDVIGALKVDAQATFPTMAQVGTVSGDLRCDGSQTDPSSTAQSRPAHRAHHPRPH